MAVHQAEVAARNAAAEIEGREPDAKYYHHQVLVVGEGGRDSIYMYKPLWVNDETVVSHGCFGCMRNTVRACTPEGSRSGRAARATSGRRF